MGQPLQPPDEVDDLADEVWPGVVALEDDPLLAVLVVGIGVRGSRPLRHAERAVHAVQAEAPEAHGVAEGQPPEPHGGAAADDQVTGLDLVEELFRAGDRRAVPAIDPAAGGEELVEDGGVCRRGDEIGDPRIGGEDVGDVRARVADPAHLRDDAAVEEKAERPVHGRDVAVESVEGIGERRAAAGDRQHALMRRAERHDGKVAGDGRPDVLVQLRRLVRRDQREAERDEIVGQNGHRWPSGRMRERPGADAPPRVVSDDPAVSSTGGRGWSRTAAGCCRCPGTCRRRGRWSSSAR